MPAGRAAGAGAAGPERPVPEPIPASGLGAAAPPSGRAAGRLRRSRHRRSSAGTGAAARLGEEGGRGRVAASRPCVVVPPPPPPKPPTCRRRSGPGKGEGGIGWVRTAARSRCFAARCGFADGSAATAGI